MLHVGLFMKDTILEKKLTIVFNDIQMLSLCKLYYSSGANTLICNRVFIFWYDP